MGLYVYMHTCTCKHTPVVMYAGMSLDDIQVQDGSTIDLEDSTNVCYSLWVSFAEIYNEFIYDLLGEEPKSRRRRPALKLAEDKNHNHFIKGKSMNHTKLSIQCKCTHVVS